MRVPGVPDSFLDNLHRLPPRFLREDAIRAFPHLHEKSVSVYLSHLVQNGVLRRVGPKEFEKAPPPEPGQADPALRPIVRALTGRVMPGVLQRVVAWSDETVAPLLHDAIVEPFIVLETPPAAAEAITSALSNHWAIRTAKIRARLGTILWDSPRSVRDRPDVFLIPNTSLQGTIPRGGIRAPIPERTFNDLLALPPLQPGAALRLLENPQFDVELALRVAGSRGQTALAASFLTWAAMKIPRLAKRDQIVNRFPHMRVEPGA